MVSLLIVWTPMMDGAYLASMGDVALPEAFTPQLLDVGGQPVTVVPKVETQPAPATRPPVRRRPRAARPT